MSMGELLLTLFIALVVFGPNKLPMLAQHLGRCINRVNTYKKQISLFWQKQLAQGQLNDNIKKAKDADIHYQ